MTRSNLRPRYVVYDEDGDRVARISVGHDGKFAHSDVDSELLTAVPSHQINKKNISDKEVADSQTQPLSQSLARTRYNNISGKTDDWAYKCPLLRQRENELDVDKVNNTSRIQWIKSPRGDSRDADPHIYVSTLAKYNAQDYLPKWALEDIAHKIGLDGFAQLVSYNLLQKEKEIIEASTEELSEDEIYIHTVDKYRMKFTAEELQELDTLVPQKIREGLKENMVEENKRLTQLFNIIVEQYNIIIKQYNKTQYSYSSQYDDLKHYDTIKQYEQIQFYDDQFDYYHNYVLENYREQWIKAMWEHIDIDVEWYTYYGVNGPDFKSRLGQVLEDNKITLNLILEADESPDERILEQILEKSDNLESSDILDYIENIGKAIKDSNKYNSREEVVDEIIDEENVSPDKIILERILEKSDKLELSDALDYIENIGKAIKDSNKYNSREEVVDEIIDKYKSDLDILTPEEWITELEETFDKKWNELLSKVEDGEVPVTTDKITPRPVSAIDDPKENVSVTASNDSDHRCAVYREWWQIDEVPALSMYCPQCGDKVYTDHGEHHTFDYSFKVDCHTCDMRLTPYNIITTPRKHYNMDEINADSDMIKNALKSYWNRAMRYGFRLGDRIAVDLRASEFNHYAEQLDIEWDMKCPFYRKPIRELDNEGLDDVEFNHIEYEDDDGNSRSQMAEGFTVSRSAHDILHMNHPNWMWEYNMGNPVEQRKFQIFKLIKEEKAVYESIYDTSVDHFDAGLLDHIRKYYDIGHYTKEELREIFTEVEGQEDEIIEAYEDTKEKCARKFAGKNDKGLNTKEQVEEFIRAKEERNDEYLFELKERAKNNEIEVFAGDKMGIIHPLVKQYQ